MFSASLFTLLGCESTLCPVWLSACLPAHDKQAGRSLFICDPPGRDGRPACCAHRGTPHLHHQGRPRLHLPQDLKVRFLRVSIGSLQSKVNISHHVSNKDYKVYFMLKLSVQTF